MHNQDQVRIARSAKDRMPEAERALATAAPDSPLDGGLLTVWKGGRMDHDREITSLAGETAALQAIVSRVLHQIGQIDPRVRHAIRVGFDEAANQIDAMAIAAGGKSRSEHFAKAVKLIEVLRLIVLKRDEPTHSA